jgi:ribonucleoside-diphosphate reductase alpha chain
VIEAHMRAIGFLAPAQEGLAAEAPPEARRAALLAPAVAPGAQCPRCAQPQLTHQEGCATCLACGYSKCS